MMGSKVLDREAVDSISIAHQHTCPENNKYYQKHPKCSLRARIGSICASQPQSIFSYIDEYRD